MIDSGTIIEARNCISHLAKFDFSVYDSMGRLLVPSVARDKIRDALLSSESGKREQERFIKSGIQKAIIRKKPSVFKGPANQYHFFIPVPAGDKALVFVGIAFYTSIEDLDDFFIKKSPDFGVSLEVIAALLKKIVLTDMDEALNLSIDVQRIFNIIVRDNLGKNAATDKYRHMVTVMELFSDLDRDINEEKLYDLLAEAILLLYGGDTVSFAVANHESFLPTIAKGRFKDQIISRSLKADSVLISKVLKRRRPVMTRDTIELLRLGYPDDISSLHIFPLLQRDKILGLLNVFNGRFKEDEINAISRLCGFFVFLLRSIATQKTLSEHINGLTAMNFVLDLNTEFQDPDTLYQSIVDVSSKLVRAERVSLMLPEAKKGELLIKAVRGMNKAIARNIRITVGAGIAGSVFERGKPLIVSDIERHLSTQRGPTYRTGAFISMPLKIGNEAIGVLNFADRTDRDVFSKADMVFLNYFVSYVSIVIKGAQYYQMSEEMRTLSITDSLTGLFNRRYFDERLFEELQRAVRYDAKFSLAIMDVDDFKLFNDSEGHLAGDKVLNAIAEISRESLRSIDIIARFGGEEFAIIMPQTDREEAFLVAERVRKNIRELVPATWKNFPRECLTVSMGVATLPADCKDAKTLINNVDKALYRAKMQGKDRTVISGEGDPMRRKEVGP